MHFFRFSGVPGVPGGVLGDPAGLKLLAGRWRVTFGILAQGDRPDLGDTQRATEAFFLVLIVIIFVDV